MQIKKSIVAVAFALLCGCGGGGGEGGGAAETSTRSCSAFKVFNGDECTSDSLPVVHLIIDGRGGCTGTIISDDIVLTAAHCVLGTREIVAVHDRGTQTATVGIAHPMFRPKVAEAFDIGLLEFPGIARNFGVQPAQFGLSRRTQVGDVLKVVGYGNDGTPVLENGNPRGVSLTVQGFYDGRIRTEFNADGRGTCFGDSGGAATYEGKIVATVQGGGENCAAGNVNLFVDLMLPGNYGFLTTFLPNVPLG